MRVLVVLSLCVALCSAHSWLQCADYTEENGRFWDEKLCRGWPRAYGSKFQYLNPPYLFGGDAGFDKKPSNADVCQAAFGTADSAGYISPSYKPGQRVCMAWPPKNHVAAKCDNINIKDSGTKIFVSGVNPTRDPNLNEYTLLVDFGASGPGAGDAFQNCPDFCSNKDKALCTGCFTIPTTMAEGKYIFLWMWAFNDAADLYSTCVDVTIANSVTSKLPLVYAKTTPDDFLLVKDVATTVVSSGSNQPPSSSGNNGGNSGNTGGNNGGNNDGNNGGNEDSERKNGGGGYSAGVIAAAVIVTLIVVSAVFVGVLFAARTFPHSSLGTFVHKIMAK